MTATLAVTPRAPQSATPAMKAITIQQPWAFSIFHGKRIENRSWGTNYRGPLAVHAGTRWSRRGASHPLPVDAYIDHANQSGLYGNVLELLGTDLKKEWFESGVMLGLVDLVDCHFDANCCRPWGESFYTEGSGRVRSQITHLVLENPRLLPEPIPCQGSLKLWTPPADLRKHLEALIDA